MVGSSNKATGPTFTVRLGERWPSLYYSGETFPSVMARCSVAVEHAGGPQREEIGAGVETLT